MRLALDGRPAGREPTAWTHAQLGKLRFGSGDARRPRRASTGARSRCSRGTSRRSTALAQVEAARGRLAARRSRSERRSRDDAAAAVRRDCSATSTGSSGDDAAARAAGRARRRRSSACSRRERRPHRPRDRALRRRSRRPARATSLARARRAHAERPSIDGDDVARLGARAERPLRRGAAATRGARFGSARATRSKLFHRGMAERCLGDARGGAAHVPARARAEPALLAPLGAGREEVRAMKRLAAPRARWPALLAPASAAAHPLGNFTVNRFAAVERLGRPALRPLRRSTSPRSRRTRRADVRR